MHSHTSHTLCCVNFTLDLSYNKQRNIHTLNMQVFVSNINMFIINGYACDIHTGTHIDISKNFCILSNKQTTGGKIYFSRIWQHLSLWPQFHMFFFGLVCFWFSTASGVKPNDSENNRMASGHGICSVRFWFTLPGWFTGWMDGCLLPSQRYFNLDVVIIILQTPTPLPSWLQYLMCCQ